MLSLYRFKNYIPDMQIHYSMQWKATKLVGWDRKKLSSLTWDCKISPKPKPTARHLILFSVDWWSTELCQTWAPWGLDSKLWPTKWMPENIMRLGCLRSQLKILKIFNLVFSILLISWDFFIKFCQQFQYTHAFFKKIYIIFFKDLGLSIFANLVKYWPTSQSLQIFFPKKMAFFRILTYLYMI